ncbi:putative glycolipid-binding domain-containing protein [Salipaludibacillus sp. HK11]|uniref:putative glycolipid-binding domain-containing protein n=1 Tax=Salipaludibacillus sp. HK11 TaxID=3394320 RepID=UPI0039FDD395
MNLKAVWKNEEQFGCEYLALETKDGNTMTAQGRVIYIEANQPIAHNVDYTIELDANWITKKLSIKVDNLSNLELIADGKGNWFNTDGELIHRLKGAIDIDISCTPFSNSLPINRMDWKNNQREYFEMVYIAVPSLEMKKVTQSYEYVNGEGEWRYFNYRCYDYETTICVDENGLVVNYPDVFSRKI